MRKTTISTVVAQSLSCFAQALTERIGAEQVLLFGSYAKGTEQHDSDVDLIIVSPHFEGIPLMERGRGLRPIWWEVGGDTAMDLFCLTPSEFQVAKDRISLISAVLPEAIDLLAA